MIAEFSQAFSALKSVTDLTRLMSQMKTDTAVIERVAELNGRIISLQESLFALREQHLAEAAEKDRLKQRVIELEQWIAEAENYALKEIAPRVFVYVKHATQAGTEPEIWLCTNCFDQRQKAMLQRQKKTGHGTVYSCPKCKTEIVDHTDYTPIAFA